MLCYAILVLCYTTVRFATEFVFCLGAELSEYRHVHVCAATMHCPLLVQMYGDFDQNIPLTKSVKNYVYRRTLPTRVQAHNDQLNHLDDVVISFWSSWQFARHKQHFCQPAFTNKTSRSCEAK